MATIKDVALEANVSIATISKVLNNKGSISSETQKRVLQAIDKIGYRKNLTASMMKSHRSYTVGLVMPQITNPFSPILAQKIETILMEKGYTMFLCNTNRKEQVELNYLKSLIERQVDGIIIFGPSSKAVNWLNTSPIGNTPIVSIESAVNDDSDFIQIDNYSGMQEAIKYIVSLKHKNIAYLTGPLNRSCNQERLEAFKETLRKMDMPVIEEFILESNFEYEGGYNLTWQLLKHPTPPTAIFTGNDVMAFGAINCIIDQNLRVPDDISVIGFDNIPQSEYFIPSLTTINQPAKELGMIAAKCILDRIQDNKCPQFYKLPTTLVIRRSTTYAVSNITGSR